MKMYFKQRLISILDSYDIYDENGKTLFTVKGKWGLTHKFAIYDRNNREVGYIQQKLISLLPKFYIHINGEEIGEIRKKLTLFHPVYALDRLGWEMKGNILEWDYKIKGSDGKTVADISKKLIRLTDTYWIDVKNEKDALIALMFVVAVDAAQCSAGD